METPGKNLDLFNHSFEKLNMHFYRSTRDSVIKHIRNLLDILPLFIEGKVFETTSQNLKVEVAYSQSNIWVSA